MRGEAAGGFNALVGWEQVSARRDHAEVVLDIRPEHLNVKGAVHGGVLATLLDVTLSFAGTHGRAPLASAVTLSLTTVFVKAVTSGRLRCVARRTGGGRTVYMAHGEILDDEGEIVATGDAVFRYMTDRAPAAAPPET